MCQQVRGEQVGGLLQVARGHGADVVVREAQRGDKGG